MGQVIDTEDSRRRRSSVDASDAIDRDGVGSNRDGPCWTLRPLILICVADLLEDIGVQGSPLRSGTRGRLHNALIPNWSQGYRPASGRETTRAI